MLSELAVYEPYSFMAVTNYAKSALDAQPKREKIAKPPKQKAAVDPLKYKPAKAAVLHRPEILAKYE
jgi:hypothetical protein